jgi:hypothetical protein
MLTKVPATSGGLRQLTGSGYLGRFGTLLGPFL